MAPANNPSLADAETVIVYALKRAFYDVCMERHPQRITFSEGNAAIPLAVKRVRIVAPFVSYDWACDYLTVHFSKWYERHAEVKTGELRSDKP